MGLLHDYFGKICTPREKYYVLVDRSTWAGLNPCEVRLQQKHRNNQGLGGQVGVGARWDAGFPERSGSQIGSGDKWGGMGGVRVVPYGSGSQIGLMGAARWRQWPDRGQGTRWGECGEGWDLVPHSLFGTPCPIWYPFPYLISHLLIWNSIPYLAPHPSIWYPIPDIR